jgi:hypothetical protein
MFQEVSLDDSKRAAADALSESTSRIALAASAIRSVPYSTPEACYIAQCFK